MWVAGAEVYEGSAQGRVLVEVGGQVEVRVSRTALQLPSESPA